MSTPITDRVSTDPAIDKRDVPARVWRVMAKIEEQNARLVAALQAITDLDDGDKPDLWRYHAEFDAARMVLAEIAQEGKS